MTARPEDIVASGTEGAPHRRLIYVRYRETLDQSPSAGGPWVWSSMVLSGGVAVEVGVEERGCDSRELLVEGHLVVVWVPAGRACESESG